MKEIVKPLLKWYQKNKRTLPWREETDFYHVWISEVMLQQTRIEAVIPYYKRFIHELPTVFDLAKVDDDRLLKLWEGLGYYNRARNLKKAAIIIVEKYQGLFPKDMAQALLLPGIGEYTASAILSICFSKKEVTVDGNVLRVYMRLANCYDNIDNGSVKKRIRSSLTEIIPIKSGDFNQAFMELGEVICLPNGIPKCDICPLRNQCKSRAAHSFLEIPVRKQKVLKKNQKYTVLLLVYNKKVALHKRGDVGPLKNLWEFPNLANKYSKEEVLQYLSDCSMKVEKIEKGVSHTHIFTHLKWEMESFIVTVTEENTLYVWENLENIIKNYALPSAFQPFLNDLSKNRRI